MNYPSTTLKKSIVGAPVGLFFGVFTVILPKVTIEHHKPLVFLAKENQLQKIEEMLMIGLLVLIFALLFPIREQSLESAPLQLDSKAPLRRHLAGIFSIALPMFLYVACAQLCFKLRVAILPMNFASANVWMVSGIVLSWMGTLLTLAVALHRSGTIKNLAKNLITAHSFERLFALGVTFLLIGLSLNYLTWFPLLALPGAYIAFMWQRRSNQAGTADDATQAFAQD
jgi:di/tricarboxylate transporter